MCDRQRQRVVGGRIVFSEAVGSGEELLRGDYLECNEAARASERDPPLRLGLHVRRDIMKATQGR